MSGLVFPSEEAKKLRESPRERFDLAIRYLPLPGAFREAAKALRQRVREKKKLGEPLEEELGQLYRLGCLENLFHHLLSEVRYGWNDRIPTQLWVKAEFEYQMIGHSELGLLGVQDKKWLEECWGAPENHMAVHQAEPPIAEALLEFLRESAARDGERFQQRIAMVLQETSAPAAKRPGCLSGVIILPIALFDVLFRSGG